MRLIDADELLKKLNEERIQYNADINYFITNAPTIDAKRVVYGVWTEKEVFKSNVVEELQSARCSSCRRYYTSPYMYCFNEASYCPYCGANMKGE